MSNNKSQAEDSNIDWLEKSITEKHIKLYEYSCFENVKQIGKGSFVCATWKNTNRFLALKPFTNDKPALEQVVKEVTNIYNYFKGSKKSNNCLIFLYVSPQIKFYR